MENINYFKMQAKNLLGDYKTQFIDEESGGIYDYKPRFFDVNNIVLGFDIDEDSPFTLMKAQHIIARMAGFNKWNELIKATELRLELGKLLFDNRHKTGGIMTDIVPSGLVEDWEMYVKQNKLENSDDETKLEIFKQVFLPAQIELGKPKKPTINLYEKILAKNTKEQSLYCNSDLSGTVIFNCENNDGKYTIGSGEYIFSIQWYTVNINTAHIRMANGKIGFNSNHTKFPILSKLIEFDFSSFDRRLQANDIIVCVNSNGKALAIRLLEAKSRSHGDTHNEVTFEYKIYENHK